MTTEHPDLLERFRKAAERGELLRAVPCRWEGKVVYRRQCCDYVECHYSVEAEAGVVVVNKTGCRVCARREAAVSTEGVDGQQ